MLKCISLLLNCHPNPTWIYCAQIYFAFEDNKLFVIAFQFNGFLVVGGFCYVLLMGHVANFLRFLVFIGGSGGYRASEAI